MPTTPASPSTRIHSWSFVYLRLSGKFMTERCSCGFGCPVLLVMAVEEGGVIVAAFKHIVPHDPAGERDRRMNAPDRELLRRPRHFLHCPRPGGRKDNPLRKQIAIIRR